MTQELGPNQRKWVEALRSGAYQQGVGKLCVGGKYCCLGVACETFFGEATQIDEGDSRLWFNCRSLCPDRLYDLLEIRCAGAFMDLNDLDRKTFTEIADLIESDPANWFTEAK